MHRHFFLHFSVGSRQRTRNTQTQQSTRNDAHLAKPVARRREESRGKVGGRVHKQDGLKQHPVVTASSLCLFSTPTNASRCIPSHCTSIASAQLALTRHALGPKHPRTCCCLLTCCCNTWTTHMPAHLGGFNFISNSTHHSFGDDTKLQLGNYHDCLRHSASLRRSKIALVNSQLQLCNYTGAANGSEEEGASETRVEIIVGGGGL